jgi:hypothetical protein
MSSDLRVLSLGAGVQSTTLALMAAEGKLPGLDAAIFADTRLGAGPGSTSTWTGSSRCWPMRGRCSG